MLRSSRYLVLAPVFGAVAAAFALFAYGLVRTMMVVWQTFSDPQLSSKGGKLLMLAFIEIFDLFLLGTVLLIMGVTFLGHVVSWDGERDLLQFGPAVSLMTAVLTLFLWVAKGARAKARQTEEQEAAAAPADD